MDYLGQGEGDTMTFTQVMALILWAIAQEGNRIRIFEELTPDTLSKLRKEGYKIKRISIAGYVITWRD